MLSVKRLKSRGFTSNTDLIFDLAGKLVHLFVMCAMDRIEAKTPQCPHHDRGTHDADHMRFG
jgi:hypothetical protein